MTDEVEIILQTGEVWPGHSEDANSKLRASAYLLSLG